MHYVYIIYSLSSDSFYIGETSDLETRLSSHNNKVFDKSFSKIADDWEYFYIIPCNDRKQAIAIEKHIKKMKSKIYIRNLILYPEITETLLKKYYYA